MRCQALPTVLPPTVTGGRLGFASVPTRPPAPRTLGNRVSGQDTPAWYRALKAGANSPLFTRNKKAVPRTQLCRFCREKAALVASNGSVRANWLSRALTLHVLRADLHSHRATAAMFTLAFLHDVKIPVFQRKKEAGTAPWGEQPGKVSRPRHTSELLF